VVASATLCALTPRRKGEEKEANCKPQKELSHDGLTRKKKKTDFFNRGEHYAIGENDRKKERSKPASYNRKERDSVPEKDTMLIERVKKKRGSGKREKTPIHQPQKIHQVQKSDCNQKTKKQTSPAEEKVPVRDSRVGDIIVVGQKERNLTKTDSFRKKKFFH